MVVESGDPYPSRGPPLVQKPSRGNILFHSPMEGHVDDTSHPDYGPNAPFLDTSLGHVIALFGTHPTYSKDISPNEEERRQYQAACLRARDLKKKIYNILGTPPPRSTVFPCNTDPWPAGYRLLTDSMKPIEPILDCAVTLHNPGQTTNPITSHIMSIPNPPGSSALGQQHSIHVSSIPSSAGGKPPA